MLNISVTSTPASCPNCGLVTKDNIGNCPKCGSKLVQAVDALEIEDAMDNGKIFAVSSFLLLLTYLLLYNPWPKRHLNGFPGFLSSVIVMGCVAGILTGILIMLTRRQATVFSLLMLLILTVILVSLDRLVLISIF